jgi:hypothetical protein
MRLIYLLPYLLACTSEAVWLMPALLWEKSSKLVIFLQNREKATKQIIAEIIRL